MIEYQYNLKMKVQRPGSRGGQFWVDDNGNIRYGAIPLRYRETLQQRAFQEWFHREVMAGRLPRIKKPQDAKKVKEWWESTLWAQAARESQQKLFKTKSKLALLPSKKNPRVKRWQSVAIDPKDYKKHGIQGKATDAYQYHDHPKWTHEWRDPKDRLIRRLTPEYTKANAIRKFKRVEKAIKYIPELRTAVQKDARSRNARRRVLAMVITTLDQTGMRVGTGHHLERYGTYGATTLNKEHVTVKGDTVTLTYVGKKNKEQKHTVTDPTYARQMRKLLKSDGDKVFAYTERGKTKSITGEDVNNYLKRYGITAKDIRTFKANVVFTSALRRMGKAKNEKQARKNITVALDEAANHLGNTRDVCKKDYISPEILQAYLEGKRLNTKYLRKSITTGWTAEEREFIRLWLGFKDPRRNAYKYVPYINENIILKSLAFSGHKLQGRTTYAGMNISIENKAGSYRTGKDPDGHKWKTKLHQDYGYIRGTVGHDKDHVDCFIGNAPDSQKVYIIHQKDIKTGKYDEDKVMLGWSDKKTAVVDYLKNYDRKDMLGSVTTMTIDQFKKKAFSKKYKGKMIKAFGKSIIYRHAA